MNKSVSRKPKKTAARKAAPARKPRADAARNRALLLEAAKAAFAEKGAAASLDEIARAAGVGIGTLYRHFPTREALLHGVYRDESEKLFAAATKLSETQPPVEALRKWLRVFLQYFATKQLVLEALNTLVDADTQLHKSGSSELEDAIAMLLRKAEEAGEIRATVAPLDLLRAIVGLSIGGAEPGWEKNAIRMIDILVAGMRKDAKG